MASNKYITAPYEWALTDNARRMLECMKRAGIDQDIAVTLLERYWPEDCVYALTKEADYVEPPHRQARTED